MNAPLNLDRDILDSFKKESSQLLDELTQVVEKIEKSTSEFPTELMGEFSQKVDRIMGAAKTLSMLCPDHPGLIRIGKLSELCKVIGYKAADKKIPKLLPIFAAFWSDAIEVIGNLLDSIEDLEKTSKISAAFSSVLQSRLEWLVKRIAPGTAESDNNELAELFKDFGF